MGIFGGPFDWGIENAPTSKFDARLSKDKIPALFNALETFSKEEGLIYRKAQLDPDAIAYSIKLERVDAAIRAANVLDPLEYRFAVYIDEAKGGSKRIADEIRQRLTQRLKALPGVEIKMNNTQQ